MGGWAGLLSVGDVSDLRPFIESRLGPVPLIAGVGHDGQANFAIAVDPASQAVIDLLDNPAYRYRRVLLPVLAGAFGVLPPEAVVGGLVIWSAIGMALGAVAVAHLADRFGTGAWVAATGFANPGVWRSAQLLTVDALAFGLSFSGLAMWLSNRKRLALVCLALGCLAKEYYALIPVGLAVWEWWRRRKVVRLVLWSLGPIAIWTLFTELWIGGGFGEGTGFGFPLIGFVRGVGSWPRVWELSPREVMFGSIAIAGLVLAAVGPFLAKDRLLQLLAWPWVAVGILLSVPVWQTGNNVVRILAPTLVFGALAFGSWRRQRLEFAHPHAGTPLRASGLGGETDRSRDQV